MIFAGARMIFAGARMIFAGARMIFAGARMIFAGARMAGARMAGARMIFFFFLVFSSSPRGADRWREDAPYMGSKPDCNRNHFCSFLIFSSLRLCMLFASKYAFFSLVNVNVIAGWGSK